MKRAERFERWVRGMCRGMVRIKILYVDPRSGDTLVEASPRESPYRRMRAWLRDGDSADDVRWHDEPLAGWASLGLEPPGGAQ